MGGSSYVYSRAWEIDDIGQKAPDEVKLERVGGAYKGLGARSQARFRCGKPALCARARQWFNHPFSQAICGGFNKGGGKKA